MDGNDIPHEPEERASRFRSVVADKRVLLLLDNARTPEQVRPLLPGAPGCLAIVTSRDALPGLVVADGGHRVSLDLLTVPESRDLLRRLLGPRAEAPAADRLISQCARLPLALRLAADLAARRPRAELGDLVTELGDEQRRLDHLDAGGDTRTAVRAVFSWSYNALSAPTAQLFRLLGLVPGPDIDATACAALLESESACRQLDELAMAHLVDEHRAGRFKFHDLLRAYARTLDPHDEQAPRRLFQYYLHISYRAERVMDPTHPSSGIPIGVSPSTRDFADHVDALGWFVAEFENLFALQTRARALGWHAEVVQLAAVTRSALFRCALWTDYIRVQEMALSSAGTLGDPEAQAESHGILATIHARLRDYETALRHAHDGLGLVTSLGPLRRARAHRAVAWVHSHRGTYRDALEHCHAALRWARAGGDLSLEGDLLNGTGWTHALLGEYAEALVLCQQAVDLARNAGNPECEAPALDSVAFAHFKLGNHATAVENYLAAAATFKSLGIRSGQVDAHHRIGDVHLATGDQQAALTSWRLALAVLNDPTDALHTTIEAKIAAHGTSPVFRSTARLQA